MTTTTANETGPPVSSGSTGVDPVAASILAALVLGAVAAILAAKIGEVSGPAHHADFVAGEMSFTGLGKAAEASFVWALIGTSGLAFAMLETVRRLWRPDLGKVLWLALLPAVYWLATRVIAAPVPADTVLQQTGWLFVSAGMIGFTVLLGTIRPGRTDADWVGAARWALGLPIVSTISAIAMLTAFGRIDLDGAPIVADVDLEPLAWIPVGTATLALVVMAFPERARTVGLSWLLALAQIGCAAGFLALLLPPAEIDGALLRQGGLEGPALPAVLLVLSAITAIGILRTPGIFSTPTLSPWAVAGALLAIKLGDGGSITYAMDNPLDLYHHGEWLLPWDQLWHHGAVPYLDLSPSHGLINLIAGGFASVFGDGSMVALQQGQALVRGAALTAAALVLGRLMGGPVALLALTILPFSGRTPILLLVAAFLACFATRIGTDCPVRWLIWAAISAVALVSLAPGQGAIALIALLPTILFVLWRAWSNDRPTLLQALGWLVIISVGLGALAVFGIGPGAVLWAQIRFILENRELYEAVHGLPWTEALGAEMPMGPIAWEILRNLWLGVVAVLAGGLLLAVVERRARGAWIYLGLAVLIYLLGTLSHTLGRIDLGGPSRSGAQTVFALAVLLPMVLALVARHRLALVLAAMVVPVGLLAPAFGPPLDPLTVAQTYRKVDREGAGRVWIDGAEAGVPKIGTGLVPASLVPMIRPSLDLIERILESDETYLDLTNRNANYFYFHRRVPVESGAVLTLSADGMQRRSLDRLRDAPPPLVLVDNGGGAEQPFPPPLRTPLIYRYLIDEVEAGRYAVWSTGEVTALINAERAPPGALSNAAGLARLDTIWGRQDLGRLPQAWGVSGTAIQDKLQTLKASIAQEPGSDGVMTLGVDLDRIGRIDFLGLRLICEGTGGPARLAWRTHGKSIHFAFEPASGLNLLPLDIWPSQAGSPPVDRQTFALSLPEGCAVRSDGVAVWARKAS